MVPPGGCPDGSSPVMVPVATLRGRSWGFLPASVQDKGEADEVAEPAQLLQGSRRGRVSQALVPEGLILATGLRVKAQNTTGQKSLLSMYRLPHL